MAEEPCSHLNAITSAKHPQSRECEECLSVDSKQPVEIRLGEFDSGLIGQFYAGVRDDNIEMTEFLKSQVKEKCYINRFRDVSLKSDCI